MKITIDTEKDIEKNFSIVIELSEIEKNKLMSKLKENNIKNFNSAYKKNSEELKLHKISEKDMLEELDELRKLKVEDNN